MTQSANKEQPSEPPLLRQQFGRLDGMLQAAGVVPETRYYVLLRLLLLKLFVEMHPQGGWLTILLVEDPHDAGRAQVRFGKALECVVANWPELRAFLPRTAPFQFDCRGDVLEKMWQVLMRISIHASSAASLQDFFMFFGPKMLKKDLAQYFTPSELTRFIVEIINPSVGERVVDPCCGTGDFIVAAHRIAAEKYAVDISGRLTGYDLSEDAIQLARLNALMHGVPCAQIVQLTDESLEALMAASGKHGMAAANPASVAELRDAFESAMQFSADPDAVDSVADRIGSFVENLDETPATVLALALAANLTHVLRLLYQLRVYQELDVRYLLQAVHRAALRPPEGHTEGPQKKHAP
jgi:hypothetical protein